MRFKCTPHFYSGDDPCPECAQVSENERPRNALAEIRRICADDALDPLGRIESVASAALNGGPASDG